MTRYIPQWLQAGSYAASQDRRLISALWPSAASSGLAVTTSTGMNLAIAPGQIAVPSPNNTGSTLCTSDANEVVAIPAAHASLNRIDYVICQPRGADLDGGAINDFIFTYVSGVPAASPVAPALPAGSALIASVYVGAGVAALVQGNITDMRPFGLAIGAASALPPPLASGAAFQSLTDDNGEVWIAKGGVNGGAWKKARDVLHGRWYRNAAVSTAAGTGSNVPYDTVSKDSYGLYVGSNFVAPIPGWYLIHMVANVNMTAAGQNFDQRVYANGSTLIGLYRNESGTPGVLSSGVTTIWWMDVGNTVMSQLLTTAACAVQTGVMYTYGEMSYLGTG